MLNVRLRPPGENGKVPQLIVHNYDKIDVAVVVGFQAQPLRFRRFQIYHRGFLKPENQGGELKSKKKTEAERMKAKGHGPF